MNLVPMHSVNPDWHNENAMRAYPLMTNSRASEIVPSGLLSDMSIAVCGFDRVFLSGVFISDVVVSVAVSGVARDGSVHGLATCTRTRDEIGEYGPCVMDPLTPLVRGAVVFGEIPGGAGRLSVRFSPDEGELYPSVVTRLDPSFISSVVDDQIGVSASGIIDLSGNAAFRTYLDRGSGEVRIRLNDEYVDSVTSTCSAVPSFDTCGMTPVRTINGVRPDAAGKITLRFK